MIRVFHHYVSLQTALLMGAELLILMLAAYAGIEFQYFLGGTSPFNHAFLSPEVVLFGFLMLFIMSGLGVYQVDPYGSPNATLVRLIVALALGFGIALIAQKLSPDMTEFAHFDVGMAILMAALGSSMVRLGFYKAAHKGNFKQRVLVLGTGSRLARFAEAAQRNRLHNVVGYVGPEKTDAEVPFMRVLPTAPGESLLSVVEKHRIDEIVVGVRNRRDGGLPLQDLMECRLKGVKVTELHTFFEREYQQVMLDSINPSWFVFGDGFTQGCFKCVVKRAFDVAASLILLILTLPVMLITAICIVLEDGMNVFYRQERVGQHGRLFNIFKFRSMRNDAEKDGKPRWAATNDNRITRVGNIIRKLRIDELPQIINVLRGEMSFVGPRPERQFFVDQLEKQIPYYSARHSLKPGITGWAQVRYAYGASIDDTVEKLQYDLYYVKNNSLFLDLMIIIATVEVVLWGKGAR